MQKELFNNIHSESLCYKYTIAYESMISFIQNREGED